MSDVVYFARDMLFTSKIREVAKQLGVTVEAARDATALSQAVAQGARLVIVDLRLDGALDALSAVTSDPASADVPTVGFIDHEKVEVMDEARARGCREVLTKGQFSHALPRLLNQLLAAPGT